MPKPNHGQLVRIEFTNGVYMNAKYDAAQDEYVTAEPIKRHKANAIAGWQAVPQAQENLADSDLNESADSGSSPGP